MSTLRENLLNISTGVLTLCAISVTAIRVREFIRPTHADGKTPVRTVSNWREFTTSGHRMGAATAPITIVEFADFQCPYCRHAATSLKELRAWYKDDVAVIYRHFPLRTHDLARPAAYAAVCAAKAGRFETLHDALYAQADSIGKKPWVRFALEAGIVDSSGFNRCMLAPETVAVVSRDSAAAVNLGVRATPTFLINETQIVGNPGFDVLNEQVIAAIRKGRGDARKRIATLPSPDP